MVPYTVTTTVLTNDSNGVADSQSPGSDALTLDGALVSGGVATCAEAQIITLTSGGDDRGITLDVVGTDADGQSTSEDVTGANAGAAVTTKHFKTVSSITPSGGIAGTIYAGPVAANGGATATFRVNRNQPNFKLGLYVEIPSGSTANVTAQFSPDYPESGDWSSTSYSNNADWRAVDGLSAVTATDESNIAFNVECVRLLLNSNSGGGVTFTSQQGY